MVHVITPWIMMAILGLLHTQIVATRAFSKHNQDREKDKRYVHFMWNS